MPTATTIPPSERNLILISICLVELARRYAPICLHYILIQWIHLTKQVNVQRLQLDCTSLLRLLLRKLLAIGLLGVLEKVR